MAEGGTTVARSPLPDNLASNLERQRSKGHSTGSRISTVEPIHIIGDDHVDSEEEKEEEEKRKAQENSPAIEDLKISKDTTKAAAQVDSEEGEKSKVKFSEEVRAAEIKYLVHYHRQFNLTRRFAPRTSQDEVRVVPFTVGGNDDALDDGGGDFVGRETDDTSLEGLARSSMEIKLYLYEQAQAEAKDHKAEMEAKLAEIEEKQKSHRGGQEGSGGGRQVISQG